MLLLALFLLLQTINFTPTEGEDIVWTDIPSSAIGIEGQSVNITWIADLKNFKEAGTTWTFILVYQQQAGGQKDSMMLQGKDTGKFVYSKFRSREADLKLAVSQTGTNVTVVFTIDNLNKTTDGKRYSFRLSHTPFGQDSPTSTLLIVLVPTVLTSPNPHYITVNESDTAKLVCTATGNPSPSINWTRHGVLVGTGVYTTDIVGIHDDKTCNYTCIAYNGVHGAKTANVCLNVQFKPRGAVVVSDKTTVCQNDNVTLTCTSGPANPAPSSYEFYNNGVLVGTSATNVYVAIATAVVNRFVCVPRNLLGGSLENGSVDVTAKEKPLIVTSPISTTVLEGNTLTLFCNASGQPAPYITWTKVGWSAVGNGETFTIPSVANGDEGTYRCTASNGAECSSATAVATVTIYCQSEIKPNFKVTKDTLTVTWKKLSESVNAECRLSVMKSSNGTTWLTASNTSQKTLLSCTVNELLSDTTYIAKFFLKLSQRYFNGTVYIVTAAQDFNYRLDKQKEDCNGTPYVILGVIIALSLLVFIILISYIIWIHKKGSYENERGCQSSKQELTNDIALQETGKSLSNRPTLSNTIPVYEDVEKVQAINTDASIPVYEPVYNRKKLSRSAYANEDSFEIQFNSPGHESSPCVATDLQEKVKEVRPKDHRDQTSVTETNTPIKYGNLNECPRKTNEIQARSKENAMEKNDYQALQFRDQYQPYMSLEHVKTSYKL